MVKLSITGINKSYNDIKAQPEKGEVALALAQQEIQFRLKTRKHEKYERIRIFSRLSYALTQ